MTATRFSLLISLMFFSVTPPTNAQSSEDRLEVGAGYSLLRVNLLDGSPMESGVLGRLGYDLKDYFSVEGEFSLFPQNLGVISKGIDAGFFGAKSGWRFQKVGVFGKARPGFVRFREQEEPFLCVGVFPPPVSCVIGGRTEFALDSGGVLEFYPTRRLTLRVDAGDTMIRFRGPVLRSGAPTQDTFWSHNFMLTTSFGFRF